MSRFVCTLSCEKKESIYFLINLILSLQITKRPSFMTMHLCISTLLRVLRLERDLRLVDHHSGVSVGDGGGGLGVDIASTPGVLHLMDQGDDDQGH